MENTSMQRLGVAMALAIGLVTAIAATIAVAAKRKSAEFQVLDPSDNWDEVLGI
jgi:hypothetical protein